MCACFLSLKKKKNTHKGRDGYAKIQSTKIEKSLEMIKVKAEEKHKEINRNRL